MESTQIGHNLKLARVKKDMRIKDVAEHLDISLGTVSHYETGRTQVSAPTLHKLCKLYEVSADDILGLKFTSTAQLCESRDALRAQMDVLDLDAIEFIEDYLAYAEWCKKNY